MKSHILVAIYDTKSEKFSTPSLSRSSADFIRTVQVEAKRKDSMLHQFPADYDLYVICDWSEDSGILDTEVRNMQKRLGSVLDLCPLT